MHTVGQLIVNQTAAPFLEPLGPMGKPRGAGMCVTGCTEGSSWEIKHFLLCIWVSYVCGSSYKGYFMNLNNKNLYKYTCTYLYNAYGSNKEQVNNGELNTL